MPILPAVGILAGSAMAQTGADAMGGADAGTMMGGAKSRGAGLLKKAMSTMTSGMDFSPANAVTAAIGVGKNIIGGIKQRKADQMMPLQEDPEERRLQRQFARKKRSFQSGTALESERAALKEMARQGMKNSFRAGGGTRGAAMMSRMFNEGMRDLASQGQQMEAQYAGMEAQQVAKLADRKLQLQLLKYNTQQARAAQLRKEGKATTNLALSKILGVGTPYDFGTDVPINPNTQVLNTEEVVNG